MNLLYRLRFTVAGLTRVINTNGCGFRFSSVYGDGYQVNGRHLIFAFAVDCTIISMTKFKNQSERKIQGDICLAALSTVCKRRSDELAAAQNEDVRDCGRD